MKLRAFFLILYIFLCMHSFAQNVEPTISDPKELSITLQQKEEVFKQLFKDPTNLSLLFKYANLSIMVGDLEGAIGVFEQMLIYDSELPRIRLELGVLYFRLGAFALANNYLKSVKEYNPPPEVEAKVDQFLEAIISAEEPFQWQQTLSIGFNRTTNGNSGINADFIENFEKDLPLIQAIPQDIGRVLLKLSASATTSENSRSTITNLVSA